MTHAIDSSEAPPTYKVHADPIPGVHILLDVPADEYVLGLADGVVRGADSQLGAAVIGDQACGAAGPGRWRGRAGARRRGTAWDRLWGLLDGDAMAARPRNLFWYKFWREVQHTHYWVM